jgi:nucleoid-associated protein YgaU
VTTPTPTQAALAPAVAADTSGPDPAPVASETAAQTASPSVAVIPEIKTVTVVRGDNLWRISRKTYGRGTRYTVIYGANTEQIRNPHLIYPGQIFVTPEDKG